MRENCLNQDGQDGRIGRIGEGKSQQMKQSSAGTSRPECEGVKVSYSEGLANHTGPESWLGVREGAGQALTGEPAGWVLSREIIKPWGADGVLLHGRQDRERRDREPLLGPTRSETPCMQGSTRSGTREVPPPAPPEGEVRAENPKGARPR